MSTNIVLKNPSPTNTLRVRPQDADYDPKTKKKSGKWNQIQVDGYIKPGETLDVWIGENRRITIEELPT
jgi:hypothetical protein